VLWRRPRHFVFDGRRGGVGPGSVSRSRAEGNACAARRHRECLDKYLPRVKIFEYASDGGHK